MPDWLGLLLAMVPIVLAAAFGTRQVIYSKRAREWPEEIAMSEEIRELVDRRWVEYGIPAHADAVSVQNGSRRGLRQLIRR